MVLAVNFSLFADTLPIGQFRRGATSCLVPVYKFCRILHSKGLAASDIRHPTHVAGISHVWWCFIKLPSICIIFVVRWWQKVITWYANMPKTIWAINIGKYCAILFFIIAWWVRKRNKFASFRQRFVNLWFARRRSRNESIARSSTGWFVSQQIERFRNKQFGSWLISRSSCAIQNTRKACGGRKRNPQRPF